MILRLVKMEFMSKNTSEFLTYFESINHKIKQMPGLVNLKLYQDVNNPNIIFTHSTWLNEEALENYKKSKLFGEVWPKTKKLFASEAVAWSLTLK
ncbi:MAG: antibiotic biosynthesis monooxygenase [Bacteroidetes bacterium]|jgi:quinol monooxygenase YgiN|nr:antibiotic biosynthesis monooxygenase [Bacteroidota bacterium]